jgi:hypothetical protein
MFAVDTSMAIGVAVTASAAPPLVAHVTVVEATAASAGLAERTAIFAVG